MSRREDRSSDSKRHRSRFDREPSPKRFRRDGKPETERRPIDAVLDKDKLDRDQKQSRRLQDALPLGAPSVDDKKVDTENFSKEPEDKTNGDQVAANHSSDPAKVPRSRSYFQHDDRGSAGQNGRSFNRGTDRDRGWWRNPKEQQHDRAEDKAVPNDTQRKDEKAKDNRDENRVWKHDGYYEMEANPKPSARKRPSFREQKIPADPQKDEKSVADNVAQSPQDRIVEDGRRDGRPHMSRFSGKPVTDMGFNRADTWKGNSTSRDRDKYGAGNRDRGDRFNPRQAHRPTGGRVEKWKHDLYEEANRSPSPKKEEDQISKIEALLSS